MTVIPWFLAGLPVALAAYAYMVYPALLWLLSRLRPVVAAAPAAPPAGSADEWPLVSISLPVYNEAAQIRDVLDSLLRLDYPAERLQIVVVSDASTDGTDAIVAEYAGRGVEAVRLPVRSGKTAAEQAAVPFLRGDIVVNTDASIRIRPDALRPLIARFRDPAVGVASGRDVSVGRFDETANLGEAGYVGYEMGVRRLETRVGGIVGASGCFYAIRAALHREPLPGHLSRDFGAALLARRRGFRAVSVDEAVCLVPRTDSLRREYRRKVRTITRGIQTLAHMRALLNPFHFGTFAWMLWSHKICRWAIAPAGLAGLAGFALLAPHHPLATLPLAGAAIAAVCSAAAWAWPAGRPMPRWLAIPAFFVLAGNLAVVHAVAHALHGDRNPTWEPTRRRVTSPA